MREIPVHESKTLKLTNVLSYTMQLQDLQNFGMVVTQMQNFIKANNAMPIGPLVQYAGPAPATPGELPEIKLLQQVNQMLPRLEPGYHMDALLRVKDCLYGHFEGTNDHLSMVYDKMRVTAYEKEIKLNGASYTVYIRMQDEDTMADVFMEKA